MADTPKSIKVKVDMDHPAVKKGLKAAYDEGEQAGLEAGRLEILDYLQKAYLEDEGRPDRDSPKATAILQVAREASEYFMRKVGTKSKRGLRK